MKFLPSVSCSSALKSFRKPWSFNSQLPYSKWKLYETHLESFLQDKLHFSQSFGKFTAKIWPARYLSLKVMEISLDWPNWMARIRKNWKYVEAILVSEVGRTIKVQRYLTLNSKHFLTIIQKGNWMSISLMHLWTLSASKSCLAGLARSFQRNLST